MNARITHAAKAMEACCAVWLKGGVLRFGGRETRCVWLCVWLLPITRSGREFKREHGLEVMESIFEQRSVR